MEEKKKKFNLFDMNRDGKGVEKGDFISTPDLKGFFKSYKSRFGRLLSVNIFMILGNFPFLFAAIAFSGYFNIKSTAATSHIFPVLHGISLHESSPLLAVMNGVYGLQTEISDFTFISYIFFGLSALILFTFGLVNVGTTYITRNMIKGDPVFMWSDFWYAIRKNKKQGIIMGILDLVFMVLITYDIIFFYYNIGSFYFNVMYFVSLALAVLYFFMRFYIYLLIITFDLSLFKVLKNSFIFTIIGFKRNILAAIGIALLVYLNYIILSLIFPLGLILPFVLTLSNCAYMSCFAAYFKIKEIMIDPYHTETEPDDDQVSHGKQ